MASPHTLLKRKLTPPALAAGGGLGPVEVVSWIRSGELRAIDASTRRGLRPRYLVDVADLQDFESQRSITPPRPRQRRKKTAAGDIEFY